MVHIPEGVAKGRFRRGQGYETSGMSDESEIHVPHDNPVVYRDFVQETPCAIQMQDVHVGLGGHPVLRGITLTVPRGRIVAIIGGSGAGKSVSLKCIVGLIRPDRGKVLLDGVDVARATPEQIYQVRRRVGYVFQNGALLRSINVFENVALPLREHEALPENELRARVEEALRQVGLGDALHKMPSELSGGMLRRAGLARALVRKPEIVLYDEPTSGLDPVKSRIIDDLIVELNRKLGVTSVVVTHDMASVRRIAARVAFLYEGRIYCEGKPEEIFDSEDPIVRQFVRGEARGPITEGFSDAP